MNKKTNQLKAGVFLSYFSIALNILAGLIYTPWMIDQIGQSQYGLYTLANSLIALFVLDFGLSSATSRYVAKLHAEGDEIGVNNFLGVVYKLYACISAAVFVVLFIMYYMIDAIYAKLTPTELQQFKVVYIIAALYSVINFPFVTLNGILTAYERFIPLKLADVIYRVLLVSTMIVALWLGYGLYALVLIHAAVGLVLIAYKLGVIRRTLPIQVNLRYNNKALYKEIFAFSLWSTVAALAQRLIFSITPSILGAVSGSASMAVFGVITTIEGYVFTITNAINGMFLPRVAKIYSSENAEERLSSLLLTVGRFQYALEGLIIAGFSVLGKDFIELWMGEQYADAYWGILLVIVPGIFFTSLQVAHTAVVMKKYVNYYAYICLATGIINVMLSVFLSSQYGAIGSCISIFVAYIFRAIMLNWLYYKKLNLNMWMFIRKCYIRMSLPVIGTILLGVIIVHMIPVAGWMGLVIKGGIISIVYLVAVVLVEIDDRKNTLHQAKELLR